MGGVLIKVKCVRLLTPSVSDHWGITFSSPAALAVIFLTARNTSLDASLISSGADGMIRWWNAEQGYLCWEMDGTQGRGEGIYAMRANTSGTLLITGDAFGWITCWDISDTCVDEENRGPESYVMPILETWRAHRRCIVSVDLAEGVGCVVTAGTDGCVRLFTVRT